MHKDFMILVLNIGALNTRHQPKNVEFPSNRSIEASMKYIVQILQILPHYCLQEYQILITMRLVKQLTARSMAYALQI